MVICLASAALPLCAAADDKPPQKLTVGIAQLGLEATLAENRDKIARFLREGRDRGCRVVVFPETALFWPTPTPKADIDAAVADLQKVARKCNVYALVGGEYQRDGKERPFERLLVIAPDGRIVQTYHKMWSDARFPNCPGLFEIDGIPCAATLCADRWIRGVEELPAMAGAKILFECSNNYADEWLADLGWYWYVPRALRNEVFVVFANTGRDDRGQLTPGHGHSAFVAPSGELLATADERSDQLLVCELDLSKATGGQALARRNHPLLKPFWDRGLAILAGENGPGGANIPPEPHQPLSAPQVRLSIAAAQMACSSKLDENVAHMEELVYRAKEGGADVVVFPELAVTGARDTEIIAARQADLEAALAAVQKAAQKSSMYVVFGMPWHEGPRRTNCAFAIDPSGKLLTRYAQLVVDRPDLFAAGTAARPMWLEIKGVPCVVTVGRDALYSELAELAALRGALVHLHLAYDRETSPEADLLRRQLWVNLASFRTFTATVNAASPRTLPHSSADASGGSILWDDFHRAANRKMGGYAPYSAVPVARAKQDETILYATETIPATNRQFRVVTEKTNAQMKPWYVTGAKLIHEAQVNQAKNLPPGEPR
jgi:predicted amidohydrolase